MLKSLWSLTTQAAATAVPGVANLSNPFASPDDYPSLDRSSPLSTTTITSDHYQSPPSDFVVTAANQSNPFASPDDFPPLAFTPVTSADLDQQQQLPGVGADLSHQPPPPAEDFFGAQASANFFTQDSNQDTETTRSVSPAKSAFEDLNDSIRAALGGSPSRSTQPQQQQQQQQQTGVQPEQQQQSFAAFDAFGDLGTAQGAGGFGVNPSQAQIPVQGYGSPAKQPLQGDGTALQ